MPVGFLYVLSNPSMPGLLKIGRTDRHPEKRAKELHTTGVPQPFVLEYHVTVEDSVLAEAQTHHLLQSKGVRTSSNREFFELDLELAKDALDLVASGPADEEPDFSKRHELERLVDAVHIPKAQSGTPEEFDKAARHLAAIGRRGCPWAMRLAADLFDAKFPSGTSFKQYYREYLELTRAEAIRHPVASSNGQQVRAAVGQAAADYLYACARNSWLIDGDFEFVSNFLVAGDQFQYNGYITQIERLKLPVDILDKARLV